MKAADSAQGRDRRPEGAPALHGIRVVDLTQFEAGTACTETLAWLGADVIKIEEPTKGDPGRDMQDAPMPKGAPGTLDGSPDSFYFVMLNANKRSVTANLKHEDGIALVRSLIEKSDVFIENFAPGVIERLGFAWDVVKEINPRIVYAQIKGFAPESRYAKYLAFDAVAQSAGGSLSVTGDPDGRPIRPGYHLGDSGTGFQLALGIVWALYQRQFTGRGQRVQIAMQEAVMNYGRASFAAGAQLGEGAHRHGNGTFAASGPCEVYKCKGGGHNDYCMIYASRTNNSHWNALLKVIGREDVKDDPRFVTAVLRFEYADEVNAIIQEWTGKHDKATVMRLLGESGVPVSAIYDTKELCEDPDLRKTGAIVTMQHPMRGEVVLPGWPVRMSDSHVPIKPSPLLGADNQDVYGDLLGLAPDRLKELREKKAI